MKKLYIILILLGIFFLSCGPSDNPTTPNNQPTKQLGRLLIAVSGLTVGLNADINVAGPNNYSKHLTNGTLLDSLEVGTYTITASAVVDTSGDTIQTTTPSQTILVEENKTASISVTYQAVQTQYGSLSVTINGLPNGVTGYARLLKSDHYLYSEISESIIISSILAGNYTFITASVSTLDDRLYVPDTDTIYVTITGGITTNIVITYVEAIGSLQVNVEGLPSGEEGFIKVYKSTWVPANGEYVEIKKSGLIDSLGEGQYTVEAIDVTLNNGDIYRPQHYYQQVFVAHQNTSAITVDYFPRLGKIFLQAYGLPNDVSAEISVATLGTYQFDGSYLIDSVEEGTYTITAWDLTAPDGQTWIAKPKYQTVDVGGGETTIAQPIGYTPKFGFLNIVSVGLPDSLNDAEIIINNTHNEVWVLNGSESLDSLTPDVYTIISSPVIPNGIDSLFPDPDSIQVNVTAGNVTDIQIEYKGYSFKVISDPKFPRQRLFYRDQCEGNEERLMFYSDTVSNIEGGYVYDICTVINADITETASSKFYEIGGSFSSGSISEDIAVDKSLGEITISKTIEGQSSQPTCSEYGYGLLHVNSEYNEVYNDFTLEPLIIEINNPFEDTILIHVSGTGNAMVDFSAVNEPDDIYIACGSSLAYSYAYCSNAYAVIDTVDQLSIGAIAWNDSVVTNQISLDRYSYYRINYSDSLY